MNDRVTRLPISGVQRAKNRRGSRSVGCIVSGRFLRFGTPERTGLHEDPVAVTIAVVTEGHGDRPDRKLCSLIVNLDELRAIVARLDAETGPDV